MRPAVYIPNYNGSQRIGRALRSLREEFPELIPLNNDAECEPRWL